MKSEKLTFDEQTHQEMVVGNQRLQKLLDTFVTFEQKYEKVLWNLVKDIVRALY